MTPKELEISAQPTNPHIMIHVGKGLVQHIKGLSKDADDEALVDMMEAATENILGKRSLIGRNCTYLTLPETRKDEVATATYIIESYRQSLNCKNGVFAVATLSRNVLEAVLAALVHIRHHRDLLVFCHLDQDKPDYTVSWMDPEGFLENWSYGCLDANVSEQELDKLKFPAPTST